MGKFPGKIHMDTLKLAIRQKLEIPSIFLVQGSLNGTHFGGIKLDAKAC